MSKTLHFRCPCGCVGEIMPVLGDGVPICECGRTIHPTETPTTAEMSNVDIGIYATAIVRLLEPMSPSDRKRVLWEAGNSICFDCGRDDCSGHCTNDE